MQKTKLEDLLKRRPGYEIVYLLLESDRRRRELAEYTNTDGGILQRWLNQAEQEGLVARNVFLCNDKKYVEYSLNCTIPSELIPVIKSRGSDGPRTARSDFIDANIIHRWSDPHSLEDE